MEGADRGGKARRSRMDGAPSPAGRPQDKPEADEFEKFWQERNDSFNNRSKNELVEFNEKPLDKWLISADKLIKQVKLYKEQGDLALHYILALRLLALVYETLPTHPEYKAAKMKELETRVKPMCDEAVKAKEELKKAAREEFRIKKQQEEKKKAEDRAHEQFVTKSVGDHMDKQHGHISAGDAMIREGIKNMGMTTRTDSWTVGGSSRMPSFAPPLTPTNGPNSAQQKMEGEVLAIGLPIIDEETDIPYILPKNNRMTFSTFVQHERKEPARPAPVREAPRPVSFSVPSTAMSVADANDADLQRALAESAAMARVEDSKMQRLRERLEMYTDFELEDVDNTGHCQFDAIAHQIAGRFATQYGSRALHYTWKDVRRDVANWLRKSSYFKLENGESVSDFLDTNDGKTWDEFCNNVEDVFNSPSPLWGNHLTLIAAANCYQRPIRVWSTAPGDDWWLQIDPKYYKSSTPIRPFEIAHLYERHYMSVTERKNPRSRAR